MEDLDSQTLLCIGAPVVTALAGAVGVLWRRSVEKEKTWQKQIKEKDKELREVNEFIRGLLTEQAHTIERLGESRGDTR